MEENSNLKEALTWILKRLESTEKFVLEQAPDILKELLRRKVLAHVFLIIIFILIAILCCYGMSYSNILRTRTDTEFTFTLSCLGLAGAIFGILVNGFDLFILKSCPKTSLIKLVRGLLD